MASKGRRLGVPLQGRVLLVKCARAGSLKLPWVRLARQGDAYSVHLEFMARILTIDANRPVVSRATVTYHKKSPLYYLPYVHRSRQWVVTTRQSAPSCVSRPVEVLSNLMGSSERP